MGDLCTNRLTQERKAWLRDHPFGFVAHPIKKKDGSMDLTKWICLIPGKEETIWEGGKFKVKLSFNANYPAAPPICSFDPPLFHPNVFTNGSICLSILRQNDGWKPSISIKQILLGIQDLLDTPNLSSPANSSALKLYKSNIEKYNAKVRDIAKANKDVEI